MMEWIFDLMDLILCFWCKVNYLQAHAFLYMSRSSSLLRRGFFYLRHIGDSYEEFGLQLSDSQPENFVRQVSIKYSAPFGGYFKEPATYDVFYTVQTPWMSGDKTNITKIRQVGVYIPADHRKCFLLKFVGTL